MEKLRQVRQVHKSFSSCSDGEDDDDDRAAPSCNNNQERQITKLWLSGRPLAMNPTGGGSRITTCCVPVGLIDCGIAIIDGIVVDRDSEGDMMMSLFLVYIIHMRLIIIHKNTIESKYMCRSHTEYVKWITHNALCTSPGFITLQTVHLYSFEP